MFTNMNFSDDWTAYILFSPGKVRSRFESWAAGGPHWERSECGQLWPGCI